MKQAQIQSESGLQPAAGIPDLFARVISDIANPLIILPLTIFGIGILLPLPAIQVGLISVIAILFFSLIPLGVMVLLLQNKHIHSLDVPVRKNRDKLYRYSIGSTTAGSLILFVLSFGESRFLAESAIVLLLNPIVGYFFNRKLKISIHCAAIATAGSLFLAFSMILPGFNLWAVSFSLFTLLVLLPVMFWSRYRLGIHTVPELAAGSATGILFTLLEIGIMQNIW